MSVRCLGPDPDYLVLILLLDLIPPLVLILVLLLVIALLLALVPTLVRLVRLLLLPLLVVGGRNWREEACVLASWTRFVDMAALEAGSQRGSRRSGTTASTVRDLQVNHRLCRP